MGKLDEILLECSSLQENLCKTKQFSKRQQIKNSVKSQFLYSIKTGDIRKAVRAIDPDNCGLSTWDQTTVDNLRMKFPRNNEKALNLNTREPIFSNTKIESNDIFRIINKGNKTYIKVCIFSKLFEAISKTISRIPIVVQFGLERPFKSTIVIEKQ